MLTDDGLILAMADVLHGNMPQQHMDTIDLEFRTPTSIKVNGKVDESSYL